MKAGILAGITEALAPGTLRSLLPKSNKRERDIPDEDTQLWLIERAKAKRKRRGERNIGLVIGKPITVEGES